MQLVALMKMDLTEKLQLLEEERKFTQLICMIILLRGFKKFFIERSGCNSCSFIQKSNLFEREFKTIGVFELKDSESISDLLLYNGGISSKE